MGEIVNLRRARKHARRAQRDRAAEQSRSLHGRTKAERALQAQEAAALAAALDGARLAPEPVVRGDGANEPGPA